MEQAVEVRPDDSKMTIPGDGAVVCHMAQGEVDKWWPYVAPFVARAVERSLGEIGVPGIKESIRGGSMQMWLVAELDKPGVRFTAACVTQVVDYESFSNLRIVIVGGEGFDRWKEKLFETIQRFATEQKCKYIEAVGRRGLEKKIACLGFEPKYVVYVRKVKRDGKDSRDD